LPFFTGISWDDWLSWELPLLRSKKIIINTKKYEQED
jgi:hypothetical protein